MTPELKEKAWGKGPWVEEPDEVFFEAHGLKCKIIRTAYAIAEMEKFLEEAEKFKAVVPDNPFTENFSPFGGFLCGYVKVPEDHPWSGKDLSHIDCRVHDCTVHGGITYSKYEKDGFWIGFDCAHAGDLVPSMESRKQLWSKNPETKKFMDNFLEKFAEYERFFKDSYRTIDYVMEETKNLAKQVAECA